MSSKETTSKVISLRYSRRFSVAPYEHEEIVVEVTPADGQSAESLLLETRAFVEQNRPRVNGATLDKAPPKRPPVQPKPIQPKKQLLVEPPCWPDCTEQEWQLWVESLTTTAEVADAIELVAGSTKTAHEQCIAIKQLHTKYHGIIAANASKWAYMKPAEQKIFNQRTQRVNELMKKVEAADLDADGKAAFSGK